MTSVRVEEGIKYCDMCKENKTDPESVYSMCSQCKSLLTVEIRSANDELGNLREEISNLKKKRDQLQSEIEDHLLKNDLTRLREEKKQLESEVENIRDLRSKEWSIYFNIQQEFKIIKPFKLRQMIARSKKFVEKYNQFRSEYYLRHTTKTCQFCKLEKGTFFIYRKGGKGWEYVCFDCFTNYRGKAYLKLIIKNTKENVEHVLGQYQTLLTSFIQDR